jgi:hypothetical protein
MASWRHREPARVEPPLWYRVFDAAMWDTPDPQERAMMDGSRGYGEWPAELREIHARRRWGEAKHRYRQAHPQLASQEFDDLVNGERAARRAERGKDYPL